MSYCCHTETQTNRQPDPVGTNVNIIFGMSQLTHIIILQLMLKFQAPIFTFWSCSVGCFMQETLLLNTHTPTCAPPHLPTCTHTKHISYYPKTTVLCFIFWGVMAAKTDRQANSFIIQLLADYPSAMLPGQVHFVQWHLTFIDPQYKTLLYATLLGCGILQHCLDIWKIVYHWTKDPVV
jgi:hypothetical protein